MRWVEPPSPAAADALAGLAEAAIGRSPRNAALWRTWGSRLVDAGRPDEAARAYRRAIELLPTEPGLRLELARALIRANAYAEGLEAVDAALALESTGGPTDGAARVMRFSLLVWMGRLEDAQRLEQEVIALDPSNPCLVRLWRETASDPSGWEALVRRCDEFLARSPGETAVTYLKAMTLARLGRGAQARGVMEMKAFVEISQPAPPPGYVDTAAFCAELADEMRRNATFSLGSANAAGNRDYVTMNLEQSDSRAVPLALAAIKQAVDRYARHLPASADGFAAARPQGASLHAWGVVNRGSGRLASHFHGEAWLSGVFYVCAPRGLDGGHLGALSLGAVDAALDSRRGPPWETISIDPTPGRLVLFPSYTPHATEPTHSEEDRISISFDVIPQPVVAAASQPGVL